MANGEAKGRFQEPTLDEIKLLFGKSGGSDDDAAMFFNYYASKGWVVGKVRMKSVGHAVAGWVHRNRMTPRGGGPEKNQIRETINVRSL